VNYPEILRRSLYVIALLGAVVLANNLAGCGGTATEQRSYHEVLNGITTIADPTYEMALESCDAARDFIVGRQGTSEAEDNAAMSDIHGVCDRIVAGFELLRHGQLSARQFIDSGAIGAALEAVTRALAAWHELQALIPEIDELGRSSGGESGQ